VLWIDDRSPRTVAASAAAAPSAFPPLALRGRGRGRVRASGAEGRAMCGIAGISALRWSAAPCPETSTLRAMTDRLTHRGPDAEGVYVHGTTGLAHRRLSIIDVASGHQPMFSRDGSVAIVFNGEIFNYIELRQELAARGRVFATKSDTEVIIHLYEELGTEFVKELNGQFAIALWDDRSKRLVLARDRVGICPLYYKLDGERLVFASEIKALAPALSRPLEIAPDGLDQIFTFWSTVSPQTVFEGVREISPGTMLVAENGATRIARYWDWQFPDRDFARAAPEDLAAELRDLLIDATKIRLRSDVPVGAYLSGGLDSSVIVCLIHYYGDVPLRTFSLTFDDENLDESSYQETLIDALQADHSRLHVAPGDVTSALVSTVRHTETPVLRTAPAPMGMLSGLVRSNGYKVVLTGEGADEVLGGYDIFKEAKVRQFWAKQPSSARRPLLLKRLYPYLNLPKSGQGEYLRSFFGTDLDQADAVHFSHLPRWNTTAQAKKFFAPDLQQRSASRSLEALLASLPEELPTKHYFNRAQYIEAKSLLGGYLLSSQGDRMLMKNSVEGRFPFLDHRVIEFANRVPPKYKMRALNEKYLLKRAMRHLLPPRILQRHKQPYRAPDLRAATDSLLSEELRSYVTPQRLSDAGFFDAKKVALLLKKAESPRGLTISESQALTGIVTTQIVDATFCH
jgi:asparagine synthase (glutamine-hydrolysing)